MHAKTKLGARFAALAGPFSIFTILIASIVAVRAQQPAPAAATAPAKPLVPVTASTLAGNPDGFIGEWVSVTGVIGQSLSRLAFAVDQGKLKSAGDILVLAPRLNGPVDPNTYVTVVGEVVRFDPDAIARKSKDYAIGDLSPELVAKYRGKPAVLATSVINAKMVDLAKRLPAPMSAEEQAFDNIMKKVGPAFAAIRQADASNADATKENAAVLKQAFADTETFWKGRGRTDAVQWAQDARKHVDAIDHAATAGNWDEVKSMAGTLGQSCQSCHTAYRERFDDGSYRIKEPPKPGGE
jgi:cytochrome c556